MANQGFPDSIIENQAIQNHRLSFKVYINGSATAASITASALSDNCRVWLESQSASAPSDANFSGLASSATPSVIGIYITDGRILRFHGASVPVDTIQSASMTAGVVTAKGAASAISGNTGVTSGGNCAFQISLTGADIDAAAIDHEFTVEVTYDTY